MTTQAPAAVPQVEVRLPHLNGSLLEVPVFEKHHRGKNWLALIDVDGTCPGGLSRQFLPRGKGGSLYLIEQLKLFDPIEFGADYQTSVGRIKPSRYYGVVMVITATENVIRELSTGALACLAAQKARTSPEDKLRALEEARAAYLANAAKLSEEIASLRGKER